MSAATQSTSQQRPLEGLPLLLVTIGISFSTLLLILDLTIANVALPYIAGDLSVPADQGTYVLTFFAVGSAISLPLTGWLTKRFGTIATYLTSIGLFVFFSFCCGAAWSIFSLVVFRFCQGFFAGPVIPLGQALLANIYPRDRLTKIMGVYAMIVLVAPAFGPVIGGYLCIEATWRWIFYINIPLGVMAIMLIAQEMISRETVKEKIPVDVISFLLVLFGMTALQLFLDKGYDWDWFRSEKIIVLAVTAFVCSVYLGFYAFVPKHPLMDFRLFQIPLFAMAVFILIISYAFYLGTIVILPLWLETYQGYDAYWAGLAIATNGVGALLIAPFMHHVIAAFGYLRPMILGLVGMGAVNIANAYFTPDVSFAVVAWYRFLAGLPIVFWIIPMINMPSVALTPEQRPMGISIFFFFRGITSGVGISLLTTIFQRRIRFHHQSLIQAVNSGNTVALDYMQQYEALGFKGIVMKSAVDQEIMRQSATQSFNDCFWIAGWGMVGVAFILLFMIPYEKAIREQLCKAAEHGQ